MQNIWLKGNARHLVFGSLQRLLILVIGKKGQKGNPWVIGKMLVQCNFKLKLYLGVEKDLCGAAVQFPMSALAESFSQDEKAATDGGGKFLGKILEWAQRLYKFCAQSL